MLNVQSMRKREFSLAQMDTLAPEMNFFALRSSDEKGGRDSEKLSNSISQMFSVEDRNGIFQCASLHVH